MNDLATLDRQLATSLASTEVSFDRPLDDIVQRGRTLRRRRRALATAAPAFALVVTAAVVVPLLQTTAPSRGGAFPTGVAPGWDAVPVSLSQPDLAGVTEECARRGGIEGVPASIMADSDPLAADRLAGGAVALWKGEGHWVLCLPRYTGGRWRADQQHALQTFPLAAGSPSQVASLEANLMLGSYDEAEGLQRSQVLEIGWVRNDVARLVIDNGSSRVEAMIVGDRFIAWLPAEAPTVTTTTSAGVTETLITSEHITFHAYDAQGRLIGSAPGK